MAHSKLEDLKGPLARALAQVAQTGPGDMLGPVWEEAVGVSLAARSRPVRLHEGELTVVAQQEFIFDLKREARTLLERLNFRLGRGAVRLIHFVKEG